MNERFRVCSPVSFDIEGANNEAPEGPRKSIKQVLESVAEDAHWMSCRSREDELKHLLGKYGQIAEVCGELEERVNIPRAGVMQLPVYRIEIRA